MTVERPALSIGAVLGDADAQSMAWKRAITALMRQVQSLSIGVASSLRVNVVYHVDGRLVPNEFTGVRTGRFNKATNLLVVQAAVPDDASPEQSSVLVELLHDAVGAAEEFGREKDIVESLPEIRRILASLGIGVTSENDHEARRR